jgi:hypothetical protein
MSILNNVENSFMQQHVILSGITKKLGLSMTLGESGWVVSDPMQRSLIMNSRQVPSEMGALEEKLRRVFFN